MPLEIVWSLGARNCLQEIRRYIARDKPDAAERFATRIVALVEALKDHPYLGRVGTEPGIHELVVGGTPYLISYKVQGARIKVVTVWHGKQLRKPRL